MKNISLQELIALNNTPKAKMLVMKYGYSPARSYNDLINKLVRLTKEHREDALKEFAEIHPHRDLILYYSQIDTKPNKEEKKSNCDGDTMCSECRSKQRYMSFEGTENTGNTNIPTNTKQVGEWKDWLPMVAMTSLVTAVLVLAMKKVS